MTDAEAQASAQVSADEAQLKDILNALPSPASLKDFKIIPVDFEKVLDIYHAFENRVVLNKIISFQINQILGTLTRDILLT